MQHLHSYNTTAEGAVQSYGQQLRLTLRQSSPRECDMGRMREARAHRIWRVSKILLRFARCVRGRAPWAIGRGILHEQAPHSIGERATSALTHAHGLADARLGRARLPPWGLRSGVAAPGALPVRNGRGRGLAAGRAGRLDGRRVRKAARPDTTTLNWVRLLRLSVGGLHVERARWLPPVGHTRKHRGARARAGARS
ncbi:hypothetical protein CC85DRAFT_37680 [Cutaneotrichosporon oleaginosum]|uniref:Uncharacterized protein n=1 Tax=Cutaneotrichosporon oleaginosum TaxID=879819 RepID=A0A0J0XBB6_9TREE|nr:uncharacterized protein CC85DRAFT_37680 [Cutaneotrichosporon oleaginosum]KLT38358.1 hypothetical protein CC85DRAFT_37680 [Cutaneotrichosporon oleaginosum]